VVDFLDVNVWVALSVPDHEHHEVAKKYWTDSSAERQAFCRTTMLGLLRVSTNYKTLSGGFLSPSEAWTLLQGWQNYPGVFVSVEPEGIELCMAQWVHKGLISKNIWTDAYLAAFACSGGFRFVSFDRDYLRFPELTFLHLTV